MALSSYPFPSVPLGVTPLLWVGFLTLSPRAEGITLLEYLLNICEALDSILGVEKEGEGRKERRERPTKLSPRI